MENGPRELDVKMQGPGSPLKILKGQEKTSKFHDIIDRKESTMTYL